MISNRILTICLGGIGCWLLAASEIYAGPGGAGSGRDVLIGFNDFPGAAEEALVRAHGGEVRQSFWLVPAMAATMSDAAAAALERNPNVRYVEADAEVFALAQTVPWGIDRVFGAEKYDFATWTTSAGDGMSVAVLDSGIDESHEDLWFNVIGGTNTIDNTGSGTDENGHGTHVAGTIAALDNGWGVVGVAHEVELFDVKVLGASGGGTVSSVVGGIEWAVKQKIPILNMSLGSSSDSQTLRAACDEAYSLGHLLVAAAGNSGNPGGRGNNVIYPARYDSVIAVAASTSNDTRASFSSTGPDVELIAPGLSILSTVPDDKYGSKSGTSMASPHVAGVAALVWAANPELSNEQVRGILGNTAEDLGLHSSHQGFGLVRADLAVAAASGEGSGGSEPEEPEEPEEPAGELQIVSFEITDVSNPNWARVRVDWHVTGATLVTTELILNGVVVDSETSSVSGSDAEGSHTLRNRERQVKTYDVRLTISDADGNEISDTKKITM